MTPVKKVFTMLPDQTLAEANLTKTTFSKRDFPIIKTEKDLTVIGMVYEKDISMQNQDLKVGQVMHKVFPQLSQQMTGKQGLQEMLQADVERAVITDENGRLQGIVSIGDIIRSHQRHLDSSD